MELHYLRHLWNCVISPGRSHCAVLSHFPHNQSNQDTVSSILALLYAFWSTWLLSVEMHALYVLRQLHFSLSLFTSLRTVLNRISVQIPLMMGSMKVIICIGLCKISQSLSHIICHRSRCSPKYMLRYMHETSDSSRLHNYARTMYVWSAYFAVINIMCCLSYK